MSTYIPINKLSSQVGLTSRTLRHWESEGLFRSMRDEESGWRVYDETAVLSVHITAILRELDIPIKEIKTVLDYKTFESMSIVIKNRISTLKAHNRENEDKEKCLLLFLSAFEKQDNNAITDSFLSRLMADIKSVNYIETKMEEFTMSSEHVQNQSLKFVTLPPMRAAGYMSVGVSPEDNAMAPVLDWIETAGLAGTARLFGGNMPPLPSGNGNPYGYGMSATIPENVTVPEHLHEMRFPGGIYARLESTDDISGSWKNLMKMLKSDEKYTSDRSRSGCCFEEHIRDDKGGFIIVLLEPVKEK